MTEETLFAATLEKATKAERDSFLEEACAGDSGLRRRIEALLESHDDAEFLKTSAAERAAIAFGGVAPTEPAIGTDPESPIDFVSPSEKPGSLGRLGHYEVLEVIGRGGMGIVLRAFDEKLHRVVAIKVMAAPLATSATARRRFAREARAAAAVGHDNIVTIHAVEETGGLPYLVMQYVAGMSLQERLEGRGPLQLHEILRIGMQTASGLAAAHAQGLIHRDIKPANILLENGVERVKITDFGLARVADDASLTQSGVVAGTPQFMAPEQARGEAVDGRSDLFSLGSVLYAMCTGRAPFRASGTMAVLKRVCEAPPGPIREANPEIPNWLVAIVEKLHEKDPARRYQSAAEVAEVLGQHLAHVQHPSVVPLPLAGRPARSLPSRGPRRRAAVAASLLCVAVGVGFSEATGVTRLTATVIRILTPDGTLVVEASDPSVKVAVEGDGELVITGAGAQEVRLRPGSYKVSATKDGKAVQLDRDLVTITRNDKQVVRVRLDGGAQTAATDGERGAFVVMGGNRTAERKLDSLAEAMIEASDGDTIEIRGNGPFVTDPLNIGNHQLIIRAANGYRPVIRLSRSATLSSNEPLLRTQAPLVVEGLEFQRIGPSNANTSNIAASIVRAEGERQSLYVANCRFQSENRPWYASLDVPTSQGLIVVRNCEFYCPGGDAVVSGLLAKRRVMVNCLYAGGQSAQLIGYHGEQQGEQIELTRNTVVSTSAPVRLILVKPPLEGAASLSPTRIRATENVFDAPAGLYVHYQSENSFPTRAQAPRPEQSEELVRRATSWQDLGNLFRPGGARILWGAFEEHAFPEPLKGPEDWKRFWSTRGSTCAEGKILFVGGNIQARLAAGAEKLTPADFRLRPDSAGYHAGPDGKDLGADIDLVGPGPAYERWKKTPEYQNWLEEIGQLRVAMSKPERNAFVILGGPGTVELRFDTLAKAILGASDGDTIEIRGNGPFVIDPIKVGMHSLTLRAASGFRPVFRLSERGTQTYEHMLQTSGRLVMEGLELQRLGQKKWTVGQAVPSLVYCNGASSYIANCRFFVGGHSNGYSSEVVADSPIHVMKNCEFMGHATGLLCMLPRCKKLTIDNSLHLGDIAICIYYFEPVKDESEIRLTRNTLLSADQQAIHLGIQSAIDRLLGSSNLVPVRFDVERTVIDARCVLYYGTNGEAIPTDKEPRLLRRLVAWHDRENLYRSRDGASASVNELGPKNVADWKQFWGEADASILEALPRFQGGDLAAKWDSAPDQLKTDDFRLRPDSVGYLAGTDGKDLGADVDLVGPGAAYERWKRTPDYQGWLKETGQVK